MGKWNDKLVKYSLLISGERLSIEAIGQCLKDGVKVLWFGTDEDRIDLEAAFHNYIEAFFLCVYNNSDSIQLSIIDGKLTEDDYDKLERLETMNPSFNLRQYVIEHDGDSPLVVVQAGAGSGKTFVMNNRLLYLMHTKEDFKFRDVVMVTFTNEATDSMRRKLIELLNNKLIITGNIKYLEWIEEVSQISISTIHSFFRRVIIEVGPLLGYGTNLKLSNMIIEKKAILRDIIDRQYGTSDRNVVSVLGITVHELEKLAMEFWKKIENNGMSGCDVFSMDWGEPTGDWKSKKIQRSLKKIFEEVEEKYNIQKLESNSIAIGDIIHEFNRVIDEPRIKEFIRNRYKYLFCDEFQDSDDVQIKTISVLDKVYEGNLFVVGDVKQSIYRFRGATDSAFERLNDNIIHEFGPEYVDEPYTLAKNYRTSEDILTEIDKIFRTWSDRHYIRYEYVKKNNDVLVPQVKCPGVYKQIKVSGYKDRERKFISLISDLQEKIGYQEKSIMVLVRYNWQLQEVKRWCEDAGKACVIHEDGGFFSGPAVRDFCSLVEALQYHSEPMYLFNLLQSAYCYAPVDMTYIETLGGDLKRTEKYLISLIKERVEWDYILGELRNRPVMSVLCELLFTIKPSVNYGAMKKKKYMKEGYSEKEGIKQAVLDSRQYEADLQKLFQMLSDSFSNEFSMLSDICNYIRNCINADVEEDSAEVKGITRTVCVQGMTVHRAKGLEFDYVLIPFMSDEFGKYNQSEILIDKNTRKVGWQYKRNKKDPGVHNMLYSSLKENEDWEIIGDETRLLYVAMTRAIEGLFCFTWWKRNVGHAQTWADLLPEGKDDANYL